MGNLSNLWKETIEALKVRHKTWDDVEWVGTRKIVIPKTVFEKAARALNYDSGFGAQVVVEDLLIVGKDWFMERHEYDGAESWHFKEHPKKPEAVFDKPECKLEGKYGWVDFEEANSDEEVAE